MSSPQTSLGGDVRVLPGSHEADSAAGDDWDRFLATKMASRRDFIARQLSRTPEERLAVMVRLARRVAALREPE